MTTTAATTSDQDPGGYAPIGRALSLRGAVALMLIGMVMLAIFASGPLHRYVIDLPLWMAPVNDWLIDATAVWHGWMEAVGATLPHDWISATVQDLRMAGSGG